MDRDGWFKGEKRSLMTCAEDSFLLCSIGKEITELAAFYESHGHEETAKEVRKIHRRLLRIITGDRRRDGKAWERYANIIFANFEHKAAQRSA